MLALCFFVTKLNNKDLVPGEINNPKFRKDEHKWCTEISETTKKIVIFIWESLAGAANILYCFLTYNNDWIKW